MKAEDYFMWEAVCIDWPTSFENVVLAAVKSGCKWFVLRSGNQILSCLRRVSIYEALTKYRISPSKEIQWDEWIVEALVVDRRMQRSIRSKWSLGLINLPSYAS